MLQVLRRLPRLSHRIALVASGAVLTLSCSTRQAGLELIITTDLKAPDDFDKVHLDISQQVSGGPHFYKDYLVPQEWKQPATFAIAAGSNANQEALIKVTALKAGGRVVYREALVPVPTDRVAELTLFLAKACEGVTCPTGQSCDAQPDAGVGVCVPNRVDSSMLPTYKPGDADAAAIGVNGPEGGMQAASTDGLVEEAAEGATVPDAFTVGEAPAPDAACPSNRSDCGTCVDVQTDNANCGGCGRACTGALTCQAGICRCATAILTPCSSKCTNTQTDPSNCGTCGHDCLGGACSAGACQPDAGLLAACVPTTATEDCIDGLDDDCNGLIDCAESVCQAAGYACTAAAPSGWSGPAVLWTGTFGTSAPACPTGYQPAVDAHAGPTGSPDTCTCGCAPSGATCSASGTFYVDSVCANPTCATVTPDSIGACTPVVSSGTCGSGGSYTMGSSLPTASGGTCTPNVTTTPGPAASWTTSARVCSWMGRVDRPGGCTNPGEQCLLGPPPGFHPNMCVYQGGDVSCPTAFPNKTLLYSGESDSRGCGTCGCSTRPAGGTCTGTVTLYGGTSGCTGTFATYTLGSSCLVYSGLFPTPSYVQAHYTMTTPATCSVTAPAVSTGTVSGTGPTTVCCN